MFRRPLAIGGVLSQFCVLLNDNLRVRPDLPVSGLRTRWEIVPGLRSLAGAGFFAPEAYGST